MSFLMNTFLLKNSIQNASTSFDDYYTFTACVQVEVSKDGNLTLTIIM